MTFPVIQDILITQGQTWTYLFQIPDLESAGSGLRLHVRDHHGASLVRTALTHDGPTNARVSFVEGGVLANLGATISTGWDMQNHAQRRWVFALEKYSLSDVDQVTVLRQGAFLVNANPCDESSIGTVTPFPSYDLACLRFDVEQTLTEPQKARARANAGFPDGGALAAWGGIGGDIADQEDLVEALAGKADAAHTHSNASGGAAGFMSAADKTKLDGIAAGATANATDAQLRDRSTHTGTQAASTISDFAAAVASAGAELTANKAQANGYASLDSGGKIPQAQLPAIAITEYLGDAANQSAMLALSGQKGDWCTRTDTGAVWIITGTDPTLLGSWTALTYPASPVTSVAGRTGAVTLSTSDISGLGTAATHNVAASGNAASGEVVKGNDTRLDVAGTVHAATADSLADADEQGFWQSASSALRKITWANVKATLKAYFDTLYATAAQGTDDRTASGLRTATTVVVVSAATAPSSGQVLTATSSTAATWQTPSSGSPGGSSGQLIYNDAGAASGAPLWRTNANTVSQHNGATAQAMEVFNTRIDASNWEKATIKWASNVLEFGTVASGTGVQRNIRIKAPNIEHELTSTCWLRYIYPGDERVFCDLSRSLQYRVNGSNNSLVILGTGNGSSTLPVIATSWYGTSVGFSATGFHVCPSAFTFGRTTFSAVETGTLNTNLSADPFTVTYGAPDAGATAAKIVGHNVAILAGSGSSGASGAANGGSVNIDGGRGYGTGTDGDIIIGATRGVLRLPTKTVATLPAATTAGRRCFVSDATATTFCSVVAGGGSNFVPVFSDGTDWRIG